MRVYLTTLLVASQGKAWKMAICVGGPTSGSSVPIETKRTEYLNRSATPFAQCLNSALAVHPTR